MASATAENLNEPARAARECCTVDCKLTEDAPWVAIVNQSQVGPVSSRLRNFEDNPVWGFPVDQSWLGQ